MSGLSSAPFNELVVSAAGSAYVNGGDGSIVCIGPDGTIRQVASELRWPNGMALLDDGRTLVVADSHAEQLLAFDVGDDGMLSGRRVWRISSTLLTAYAPTPTARSGSRPSPADAVCASERGANVLGAVPVDRGCFACMLAGEDGRTLFIAAAQWRGMEAAMKEGPGLTGQLLAAPDQPAPHAGRP